MKVAIVHDDFIQHGGAEKLIFAVLEMFPDATLYSTFFTEEWKKKIYNKFPDIKLKASFLQKWLMVSKFYKFYALLFPIAIESMDFSGFDLVISSSARYAHGIVTKPETKHIAYVNSPARMWWEEYIYFGSSFKLLRKVPLFLLRQWDFIASKRPDFIIANSSYISEKIRKYWDRDSTVIFPFHEMEGILKEEVKKGDYYVVVSRLESWKNIDIVIKACEKEKKELLIVGDGKDINRLKSISNSKYIKFVGRVSKNRLIEIYKKSKALIIPQKEDFGIISLEAQSFGKPVIAYGAGGVLDTVINKKTGLFFNKPTSESLVFAIQSFEMMTIDPKQCILNAHRFTKTAFKDSLLTFINKNVKYQ